MAENTPRYDIHSTKRIRVDADDSGYLTNTPNSVGSLDSLPREKHKLLCQCTHHDSGNVTPDISQQNTPDASYCRVFQPCFKKKISTGIEFLQRSSSPIEYSEKFSDTESPLQTRSDLLLNQDFYDLSLETSRDKDKTDQLWNVKTANCVVDQTIDTTERHSPQQNLNTNCTFISSLFSDSNSQLSDFSNDDSINTCRSERDCRLEEQSVTNTNRYLKINTINCLQEPVPVQGFQETSLQQLISLKHSSQRYTSLVGHESVDFLSLLGMKSDHWMIVRTILGFLEPVDLTAAVCVSKTWNMVCKRDSDANKRIEHYIEQKQKNKENWTSLQMNKLHATPTSSFPRSFLREIQNVPHEPTHSHNIQKPSSAPPSPSKRRFIQFFEEGQKLGTGQMLAPCPRCSLPSQIDVVSNVGRCTHKDCQYLYCCICHCESHGKSKCPISLSYQLSRKRPGTIGSKESKKLLRRL